MTTSPATRGRSARLPRDARRAQLLVAAQEVFVRAGYHAAAMDEIADQAGVSKPVLYQHFPSKLELYLALLDQHTEAMVVRGPAGAGLDHDNKQRVAATMAAYFEFVDRKGEPFRLVFESDLTNEAAVRERVDAVTARCAEAIAEVIREDTALPQDEANAARRRPDRDGPGDGAVLDDDAGLDPARRGQPVDRPAVLARSRRVPEEAASATRGESTRANRRGTGWTARPVSLHAAGAVGVPRSPSHVPSAPAQKPGGHPRGGQDRRPERRPRDHGRVRTRRAAEVSALVAPPSPAARRCELTDDKGRTVIVPAGVIGYVEIGAEGERRVGFGTV